MLGPNFTGQIIDEIEAGNGRQISDLALKMVAAGIGITTLSAIRRVVAGTISLGLEKQLRDSLFRHLLHMICRFFDRMQTGQLISRMTVDVTQVRFFLGYGLLYFFMHVVTLIAVPVALFRLSPTLALAICMMLPLLVIASTRYSRLSHEVLKEVQQREALLTAAAEENIVGARVVRAFGQENAETSRFRTLVDDYLLKEREQLLIGARYQPLYALIPGVALAVVVLLAGPVIDSGALTLGEFFQFYLLALMLTGPLRSIGFLLSRAQRATASGERLWELLDTDEQLPSPAVLTPEPKRDPRGSAVHFDAVTFSYQDGRVVIDDVTLTIEPGTTVALLGATGSGKSTLASLVPRFYDPDGGRVVVDGVDVRDRDVQALRRTVGIVDQEPFLFSATVAENMRFGVPDISDGDIWQALEAAQAAGFVKDLPDGIDTVVGERGLTLSGGQRQRLSIARALVTDPRILILDDATASVDSRVESDIASALDSATHGRTTIVIAHRPSTIALADRIVVLERGRIIDDGTHEELLARSELYQQVHEQKAARREFLLDEPSGSVFGDPSEDGA